MEHIDVTFGGRSVRLKQLRTGLHSSSVGVWRWAEDGHRLEIQHAVNDRDWKASYKRVWPVLSVHETGDTAHAAVAAVESKLRDLRDQLTSILGDEQ